MRNKALLIFMAAAIFLFACGVAPIENKNSDIGSPANNNLHADKRITKAQMLLDYDAMWDTMKESYPLARSFFIRTKYSPARERALSKSPVADLFTS